MNTPTNGQKLSVLFVTPEVAPLIKTGGLADVSASLPVALTEQGVDVRVLVPGYPQLRDALTSKGRVAGLAAIAEYPASQLLMAKLPSGVQALVIDSQLYDRRGGPYQDNYGRDYPDNDLRFGLLSYVASILGGAATPIPWRPQVVHCNDWQAGLAPVYLHFLGQERARTVMTIHNVAYQGIFPPTTISRLGLPPSSFTVDGAEYYGNMSFLKAGIAYADWVTTVSPSYAEEIQREPLGMGMQGLLAKRRDRLTGILNGIDTDTWDPETDPYIERYYNAARLAAKADNKRALQERLRLAVDPAVPLIGVISRLTHQKGLDLVLEAAERILTQPAQLAVLGSGDAALQDAFQALARAHPRQVGVQIGYDEALAHQIEAGADIFLMPSRFEPCGLNQMYSQRYGTVPVVHATGGLRDSVVDASVETLRNGAASGFQFEGLSAENLHYAVARACLAFHDKRHWRQIQKHGMARDFSWGASARRYIELYESLLKG